MSGDFNPIRGERLVALRLWEGGYLSDQDLLKALEDISRREWPPGKKYPVAQELEGKSRSKGNDAQSGRRTLI
jgi:hypothetical protein